MEKTSWGWAERIVMGALFAVTAILIYTNHTTAALWLAGIFAVLGLGWGVYNGVKSGWDVAAAN